MAVETIIPTIASSKVGVLLMIHRRRTSVRRMQIHKPRLSSCTSISSHSFFRSSQDCSILSLVLSSSGLCFVFRAQTLMDSVGTVPSPCALRRQYIGKESQCVSNHTHTLRTPPTPVVHNLRRTCTSHRL